MKEHELLGISEDVTPEEIRAAYKIAVQRNHPDKGGDIEKFHQIQKAYKKLSKTPCSICGGKGKIEERNGAFKTTKDCPRCLGERNG